MQKQILLTDLSFLSLVSSLIYQFVSDFSWKDQIICFPFHHAYKNLRIKPFMDEPYKNENSCHIWDKKSQKP